MSKLLPESHGNIDKPSSLMLNNNVFTTPYTHAFACLCLIVCS